MISSPLPDAMKLNSIMNSPNVKCGVSPSSAEHVFPKSPLNILCFSNPLSSRDAISPQSLSRKQRRASFPPKRALFQFDSKRKSPNSVWNAQNEACGIKLNLGARFNSLWNRRKCQASLSEAGPEVSSKFFSQQVDEATLIPNPNDVDKPSDLAASKFSQVTYPKHPAASNVITNADLTVEHKPKASRRGMEESDGESEFEYQSDKENVLLYEGEALGNKLVDEEIDEEYLSGFLEFEVFEDSDFLMNEDRAFGFSLSAGSRNPFLSPHSTSRSFSLSSHGVPCDETWSVYDEFEDSDSKSDDDSTKSSDCDLILEKFKMLARASLIDDHLTWKVNKQPNKSSLEKIKNRGFDSLRQPLRELHFEEPL